MTIHEQFLTQLLSELLCSGGSIIDLGLPWIVNIAPIDLNQKVVLLFCYRFAINLINADKIEGQIV